jgi:hypothetical protein
MLVAVSITVSAVVVALHLHVGFRTLAWVTTISTVRATVRECCTGKSACSHKGRCAKDGREVVPNAAKA